MIKLKYPLMFNIRPAYKANVFAQSICFIINCSVYYISDNPLFLWVAIATICFIGVVTSQPPRKIFDINIFNHFVVVIIYYIVSHLSAGYHFTYFGLIFIFTYVFFILKDSGYDKSLTIWTYVQCLAVATTLTELPFHIKITATIISYVESQLVIYIAFRLFPSGVDYVKENNIINLKQVRLIEWYSLHLEKVKLAIRGAMTAGVLYIICVTLVSNDLKPNWAVVVAIGCILKNDDAGSKRTIITGIIGTFIGLLVSSLVIKYNNISYHNLVVLLLWISLVISIICMFEYRITLSPRPQILGIVAVTVALTCLYLILDQNGKFFLELRVINNYLGIGAALIAYVVWKLFKHYTKWDN